MSSPVTNGRLFHTAKLGGQNFRRDYGCLCPNVSGCVEIGGFAVAARNTRKGGLVRSVPLVDQATTRASNARVAWIGSRYRDAVSLSFVSHKTAQLAEGPRTQARSLTAPNRYPVVYAFQVFKGNATSGAFSSRYDHLRYAMINVFPETLLLSGEFTEASFGGFSTSFLKPASSVSQPPPNHLDIVSSVNRAVAIYGQRDYAEVYAKPVRGCKFFGLGYLACCCQHPFASDETQIYFTFTISYKFFLVFANCNADCDSAIDCPQIYCLLIFCKPYYAIVVRLSTRRAENWRSFTVYRESVCDLSDRSDGGLCGQAKTISDVVVGYLLQIELSKYLVFKTYLANPCRGLVAAFQGHFQRCCLIRRRQHPKGGNQFHSFKYRRLISVVQVR